MENAKRYEYVWDQSEVREFCLYAMIEQLIKLKKWMWIRLALVFVLELVLLPQAAVLFVVIILISILITVVRSYVNIRKSVSDQQWGVQVGGGRLKVDRETSMEVSCSSIKMIRITRRLLMLGYLQTEQRPVWFVLPLRIFADEQERERFLDEIRRPQDFRAATGLELAHDTARTDEQRKTQYDED